MEAFSKEPEIRFKLNGEVRADPAHIHGEEQPQENPASAFPRVPSAWSSGISAHLGWKCNCRQAQV